MHGIAFKIMQTTAEQCSHPIYMYNEYIFTFTPRPSKVQHYVCTVIYVVLHKNVALLQRKLKQAKPM